MATSLQLRPQPFDMGIHNRDAQFLTSIKQEHVWTEMAPECIELLTGFDMGRTDSTSSSDHNPAQLWGSTPGVTCQVMNTPNVFEQTSRTMKEADGVQMAILALKGTTGMGNAGMLDTKPAPAKAPKKKRAPKKAAVASASHQQRCVSPKDVSPPPNDVSSGPKKMAKRLSVPAQSMDPDMLADKRARNKVAAEKCRRKRLARVANTEQENVELKSQVDTLQVQLSKIKDSMRAVIAKTDGGKRHNETVPAMLMEILMNL